MFTEKTQDVYFSEDYVIQRYYGLLPSGERSQGNWAVWSLDNGEMVDWSQYLNDLTEHWKKRDF